jgi:hypothetical protein
LRESADERTDHMVLKRKVETLVRDGLKLAKVTSVEAKRKPDRCDRPRIVIATVETKEQKAEVMKANVTLRRDYVESDLTINELHTQSSVRTILPELGKERDYSYIVTGNRLVHISEDCAPRASNNGSYNRNCIIAQYINTCMP